MALLNAYDPGTYRPFAAAKINDAGREIAQRVAWGLTLRGGVLEASGLVTFAQPVFWTRIANVWTTDNLSVGVDRWAPSLVDGWELLKDAHPQLVPSGGTWGAPADPHQRSWVTRYGASGQEVWLRGFAEGQWVAVEGYRSPATLSVPTDLSELGDPADAALATYARAKIAQQENDHAEHGVLMTEFDRLVEQFAQVVQPQVDEPAQIPGHMGGC